MNNAAPAPEFERIFNHPAFAALSAEARTVIARNAVAAGAQS